MASVIQSMLPTIRHAGKDWSGFTERNNLGALFDQKPIQIGGAIEKLFQLDLGEDIMSMFKKFNIPTYELEDDRDYEWLLMGADQKNIPLVAAYKTDGTAFSAGDKVGINNSRFLMEFGEKLFFQQHVIVGNKPDLYHVLLRTDGRVKGSNFVYEAELVTGSPSLFIPVEDVAAGTRWSADYSLSEQVLSKKGSDISFNSPIRMANRISMLRKEHTVAGDMIGVKNNSPYTIGLPTKDGKVINTWINKADYELKRQFRREFANLLWYGKSNRRSDGTYGNIGDSGYEIKAGMGFRDQISPSNKFYYNKFNLDTLVDYALNLSVGKLPEDARKFVIGTGEHGLKLISREIEKQAGANAIEYNRVEALKAGEYTRPQWMKYADINGVRFEFVHIPSYDDQVRNKVYHPDGYLAESARMTIMDFGTTQSKPNIQMVRLKGQGEVFAYLPGLRDPFSPGGMGKAKMMASKVDGYEVTVADWGGIMVRNPMRCGEWIPNILG
jgi:hypothetical protein